MNNDLNELLGLEGLLDANQGKHWNKAFDMGFIRLHQQPILKPRFSMGALPRLGRPKWFGNDHIAKLGTPATLTLM